MRWTVLIPAKALPGAKSRLAPASADAESHRRLVEAIRADTISAALAASGVARVVLVVDMFTDTHSGDSGTDGLARVVQTSPGLNGAVRDGVAHAVSTWPADGVVAVVGDLPALRPDELSTTLAAAAAAGTGFVPDAEGTGTTLLAAAPGHRLDPRFGAGSAARHAADTVALPAGPGLRRDVDTGEDLRAAAEDLGVGPATAAVLAAQTAPGAPQPGDPTARSTSPEMIGE